MLDGKAIGEKVIVGVVSALALGALTLFWNWASNGGVIRALGGVTEKGSPINFGLVDYPFSNLIQGAQIPGSEGALFCGLTLVDDDTPSGSCEINRDGDNHWIAKTGDGGNGNACRATCLLVKNK